MNHCLISNFLLSKGSKFHFRFPISTSGEWIEPWPVNDKGSFDVTLNKNCCDLASRMAQAVLIIVGTFFDCFFLCLIFLYLLKQKVNTGNKSIMSPHEIEKCRLKNWRFWKFYGEKFQSLVFQLRISRHKTLQLLNFSNLTFQLQVSPMMNTGYNCRYFCWTRDWSFDKSWWIPSTSYYLYDMNYII